MVNLRTTVEKMWNFAGGKATPQDIADIKAAGYQPDDFSKPNAWGAQWNEFRVSDALEFARAYEWTVGKTEAEINERIASLSRRMDAIMGNGEQVLTYLLAAYRGYEYALISERSGAAPAIVKLNDAAPDMVAREAWFVEPARTPRLGIPADAIRR